MFFVPFDLVPTLCVGMQIGLTYEKVLGPSPRRSHVQRGSEKIVLFITACSMSCLDFKNLRVLRGSIQKMCAYASQQRAYNIWAKLAAYSL